MHLGLRWLASKDGPHTIGRGCAAAGKCRGVLVIVTVVRVSIMNKCQYTSHNPKMTMTTWPKCNMASLGC